MINIYTTSIQENEYGYYIVLIDNDKQLWDALADKPIAMELNLELDIYQKHLINNFNACEHTHMVSGEIYFKHKIDIIKACEWVNSILIANQLAKSGD